MAAHKYTTAEYIAMAQAKHGMVYDYTQVVYTRYDAQITIICPQHGAFEQRANTHLSRSGCARCGFERPRRNASSTTDFISKAQAVHGTTYDYGQAVYNNNYTKLTIRCVRHGAFEQQPTSHLNGCGCPQCANDIHRQVWVSQANGRPATLYFLRLFDDSETFYKVGITYRSVKQRYGKQNTNGYRYEVLATHTSLSAARIYEWEQSILESFAYLRYCPHRPFGGATECFRSAHEILAIFPL